MVSPRHPVPSDLVEEAMPQLLGRLEKASVQDADLQSLLTEVRELLARTEPTVTASSPVNIRSVEAAGRRAALLAKLQTALERVYEGLLLERMQLGHALTNLNVIESWTSRAKAISAPPHRREFRG